MLHAKAKDLDYIVSRLHGEHGAMLFGSTLSNATQIRTIPELTKFLLNENIPTITAEELQKRYKETFSEKINLLSQALPPPLQNYISILNKRNEKSADNSLESDLRETCVHYKELLAASKKSKPFTTSAHILATLDASIFLAMLALRLTFNYHISVEKILTYHFHGSLISLQTFLLAVKSSSPEEAISAIAPIIAPDTSTPKTIPELEKAARNNYYAKAKRIWVSSENHFAAIVGYIGLKQIELYNLTTLSEGLRLGLETRKIQSYLIPRQK